MEHQSIFWSKKRDNSLEPRKNTMTFSWENSRRSYEATCIFHGVHSEVVHGLNLAEGLGGTWRGLDSLEWQKIADSSSKTLKNKWFNWLKIEILLWIIAEIGENIRIYGSVNPSFGRYKMISPYCYKPSVDILLEFWGFNRAKNNWLQIGDTCVYIYICMYIFIYVYITNEHWV